jgi:hypothetical protein
VTDLPTSHMFVFSFFIFFLLLFFLSHCTAIDQYMATNRTNEVWFVATVGLSLGHHLVPPSLHSLLWGQNGGSVKLSAYFHTV